MALLGISICMSTPLWSGIDGDHAQGKAFFFFFFFFLSLLSYNSNTTNGETLRFFFLSCHTTQTPEIFFERYLTLLSLLDLYVRDELCGARGVDRYIRSCCLCCIYTYPSDLTRAHPCRLSLLFNVCSASRPSQNNIFLRGCCA